MLRTALTTAGVFALTAGAAMATTDCSFVGNCPTVPEISALEGTAALAAVLAVVALVWERRRRAA
ncbi:hypothetical protein [Dinoroseobacter sp. S375]|uniref:hypothetical protein n=1 Tax=Dinoroseobacter sp. S375 TaxID=3415136 RepID=UPI003C797693